MQNFGIFWPVQNLDVNLPEATVRLSSEGESGGFQTKDFTMSSSSDNTQWQVKLVFSPSWPLSAVNNGGNCGNLAAVTDLLQVVQSLRGQEQPRQGPILVSDRFGGTEAATFCALHTLLRQLEFESHVDVYEYVRTSHLQRPGIWRSQDAYFFLYRVLDAVCGGGAAAAAAAAAASTCSSYADSCVNFQTFKPVSFYPVSAAAVAAAATPTAMVDVVTGGVPLSTSTSSDGSNSGSVATTVIRIPPEAGSRDALLRPTNDSYQRY